MAVRLPSSTFVLLDGSVISVSENSSGSILPRHSVSIRFNQTTVRIDRPAQFLAAGPIPTNYLEVIAEGIRVLEHSAELLRTGNTNIVIDSSSDLIQPPTSSQVLQD
jgi:hypothetical protein